LGQREVAPHLPELDPVSCNVGSGLVIRYPS
jgi:hypothetical protein